MASRIKGSLIWPAYALGWLAILIGMIVLPLARMNLDLIDKEIMSLLGVVLVLWVFVLWRKVSLKKGANVIYALLWLAALSQFLGLFIILSSDLRGSTAQIILTLILFSLTVGFWIVLLIHRVPWRWPWLTAALVLWPLGPLGIVFFIGLGKLTIELSGRRGLMTGSRIDIQRASVAPRGMIESKCYEDTY